MFDIAPDEHLEMQYEDRYTVFTDDDEEAYENIEDPYDDEEEDE